MTRTIMLVYFEHKAAGEGKLYAVVKEKMDTCATFPDKSNFVRPLFTPKPLHRLLNPSRLMLLCFTFKHRSVALFPSAYPNALAPASAMALWARLRCFNMLFLTRAVAMAFAPCTPIEFCTKNVGQTAIHFTGLHTSVHQERTCETSRYSRI